MAREYLSESTAYASKTFTAITVAMTLHVGLTYYTPSSALQGQLGHQRRRVRR
jgi:hypothetical protein